VPSRPPFTAPATHLLPARAEPAGEALLNGGDGQRVDAGPTLISVTRPLDNGDQAAGPAVDEAPLSGTLVRTYRWPPYIARREAVKNTRLRRRGMRCMRLATFCVTQRL
jgi:hypothetical protein